MHATADKDRDDIQHQTELQERALDGIDSALDDLGLMSKVAPPLPPSDDLQLATHPTPCCALHPPHICGPPQSHLSRTRRSVSFVSS